jgi:hypothetical protein
MFEECAEQINPLSVLTGNLYSLGEIKFEPFVPNDEIFAGGVTDDQDH